MKIKVTSIYVDDQAKALNFYSDVLGFAKKSDFSNGPYRWLTVASPEEPNGTELQLALNNNPAGKVYQQAIFQQNQPAAMFFTDDVKLLLREYSTASMSAKGIPRGGLTRNKARRVIEYLEANLGRALTVRELADVAELSTYHFVRMFKRTLGTLSVFA
jgi:catechol 2,3-dioxygenase-like lactoylglutathione lyase family enzyme